MAGILNLRFVVALAVLVGMLTVLVSAMIILDGDPSDTATEAPQAAPSEDVAAAPSLNPGSSGSVLISPTPEAGIDPVIDPANPPFSPDINVQKPEFTNYTENITRVREHYSERYTYGTVTVAWRPGSFPPEHAAYVADTTARLLGEANAKIQTNYYPEMEVFLADQLYAPECMGCQGFAAADLFQIFILHDGSVAQDEFEALLLHEIVHVIAAHEISLPHSLFYAEGLATWAMAGYLDMYGYLSPVQTAAWAYEVGAMPSLDELRADDFAGRVRKRVAYDGAAAFAFFVIDTYGYDAYRQLYTLDPPEMVLDKTWQDLEGEWHEYLSQWTGTTVNGTDAHQWWGAMTRVIEGFGTLYADPGPVTAEQYADLVKARLAVNRGEVAVAIAAIDASGLAQRTAQ